MSDIEPFDTNPQPCPKCLGNSDVDRYIVGAASDDRGGFVSVRTGAAERENLVVQCRACGYERLMDCAP